MSEPELHTTRMHLKTYIKPKKKYKLTVWFYYSKFQNHQNLNKMLLRNIYIVGNNKEQENG